MHREVNHPENSDKTGAGYEKAIQFIKIRPHHSEELRRKLSMRGFDKSEVSLVLSRLLEQGLLNDQVFAASFLASLVRYKTYGFYGLKAKLMSRGIPAVEAESLLLENFSLDDETKIAEKLLAKERTVDRMKFAQKLSRKGFRSQVISRMLGKLSEFVV